MMMQFTATNTLIQAMVPDQLRGRVMSLYSMMFLGMSPLGSLLAGAARGSHWRAGNRRDRRHSPVCIGGLAFARKWPAMRGPARDLIAAQGMMAPAPQRRNQRRLREKRRREVFRPGDAGRSAKVSLFTCRTPAEFPLRPEHKTETVTAIPIPGYMRSYR